MFVVPHQLFSGVARNVQPANFWSSGYVVSGRPNRASPAEYASNLRPRSSLELAQALVGLERRQAGHARPVGLEVGAELGHVDDEHAHVAHEGLLVLHLVGHRLEPAPRVLEVVHLVGLLLRDVDVVLGEQAVLLEDGAELRESSIVSFSRMAAR